jgi:hypothetical protein
MKSHLKAVSTNRALPEGTAAESSESIHDFPSGPAGPHQNLVVNQMRLRGCLVPSLLLIYFSDRITAVLSNLVEEAKSLKFDDVMQSGFYIAGPELFSALYSNSNYIVTLIDLNV